jgi:F-type H+-transporting ATPase subunit delta
MQVDPTKIRHETVLDVTSQQIARVYAQALLGAAESAGQLDDVVEAVDSLVQDVLEPHPGLERMLTSARVSAEDKEGTLDRVFGGSTSQVVLSFLKVLGRHGRLNLLRDVRRELREAYNKRRNRVDVEIRVARELSDATRAELQQTLAARFGAEPIMNVRVDPALIAGVVIRVGDTVYDASVATRFRRAQDAMVKHAVEMIQTKREQLLVTSQ